MAKTEAPVLREKAKVRNRDFKSRLAQVCDSRPDLVPPFGKGRVATVARRLNVTEEAASKWFAGLTKPQPRFMPELARFLEVDESWLERGIVAALPDKERAERNAEATGAVSYVAGLIQMNGGVVAFPTSEDARGGRIDLYAIIRAKQFRIHVSLAREIAEGEYKFPLPAQHSGCRLIGVVHTEALHCDLLDLRADLVERHQVYRGGYMEVPVSRVGKKYRSGADSWSFIETFRTAL